MLLSLHEAYRRAEHRGLFGRIVTLARHLAGMVLLEPVVLRGLTQGDDGRVTVMVSHQYAPFQLHPYPVDMIEEFRP